MEKRNIDLQEDDKRRKVRRRLFQNEEDNNKQSTSSENDNRQTNSGEDDNFSNCLFEEARRNREDVRNRKKCFSFLFFIFVNKFQ